MAQRTSEDLSVLLQNYLTTISEKDEDIYKLFEENKRLRGLLDQLHAIIEDRESRLQASALRLASAEGALDHSQQSLARKEAEVSALLHDTTSLRTALLPSSEDHKGLRDVVSAAQALRRDRDHLYELLMQRDSYVRQLETQVAAGLQSSEERERYLLEEMTWGDAFTERAQMAASHSMLAYTLRSLEAEMRDVVKATKEEHDAICTRHRLEVQHLRFELQRAERQVTAARDGLHDVQLEMHRCKASHDELMAERQLCWPSAQALIDLLAQRCTEGESAWAATTAELHRTLGRLALLTAENSSLSTQLLESRASHDQDQRLLQRRQSQLNDAAGHKQAAMDAKARLDALHVKHSGLMERERGLRKKYAAAQKELSAQQQLVQRMMEEQQKSLAELMETREAAAHQRAALQKQIDDLREGLNAASATQHELLNANRLVKELRDAIQTAEAAHEKFRENAAEELRAVQQNAAEAQRALEAAHQARVQHLEDTRRSEVDSLRDEHEESVRSMRSELQEWVAMAEARHEHAQALKAQLESERRARQLLEEQQRLDGHVTSKLLQDASEASRLEATFAEKDTEVRALKARIELLMQACQRSTAVIAELRECLHRERQEGSGGRAASLLPSESLYPHIDSMADSSVALQYA